MKKQRVFLCFLLTVLMVAALPHCILAEETEESLTVDLGYRLYVNDTEIDGLAFSLRSNYQGDVYVPLRGVAEALGMTVEWMKKQILSW